MKNARLDSKKIREAAKTRRVAGVQVRSGVKAGKHAHANPDTGHSRIG